MASAATPATCLDAEIDGFRHISKSPYSRSEITVCVNKGNHRWTSNNHHYPGSLVEESRVRRSAENVDEDDVCDNDSDEDESNDGLHGEEDGEDEEEDGFHSIALDETQSLCSQGVEVSASDETTNSADNLRLKSSDWINEQLEMSKDSLVFCRVSPKTKHVVHFNVKHGDVIVWEFATSKRNLGFGVLFESTTVEGDLEDPSRSPKIHNSSQLMDCSSQDNLFPILPEFVVNSHVSPIMGSHTAISDGIYVITFDNSYSKFFSKDLFYRITAQQAADQLPRQS
eukprot:m.4693 g.4693  ORF g.4693 m.4693 type:complete len:284 (+) comp11125_c0_seq2:95-946(+)